MRILIVEDNRNIAAYTSTLLTRNGYEVVVALDGRLGLDELKQNSFELVLLDLNLPDINGIEILRFIRTSSGFTELPVIILSGESNDDIIDNSFELGANDFIRKPFKDRNLLLRVEKQLQVQKLTRKLISNEERMRQITENMTDMAYTTDLNLNISYISPSVEKILGFTVDEYMGFPVYKRYPQSTIDTVKAILEDEISHDDHSGIDKDRTRIIEIEQFHKNGSIVILSLNNRFLRDSEANPIGLYGVARDVTALKVAEHKLRESEERFKKLSSLTIEGVVIHKNTKVVDVNEAFERLVGYSRDELLGQSILEMLIHSASHQVVKDNLSKSHTTPYQVIGLKKGGFLFDAEIEARDIEYNGQKLRVAAVRDVTEWTKLQKRLEQTNRHNAFLSNLSFRLASENIDIIKQIALPMIKQHCGAVYAHFSTYHADSKTLQLVHIDADSALVNMVKKVGGSKIFNTLTPVSEDAYRYILANNCKLMHSLDELSFGEIPPLVDKAVKTATGFRFFYAIAHVLGNKLYGVTVLAFRKDQVLPQTDVLLSYANIMAVSIKNSLATASLVDSEHKLKTIIENIPDLLFHMDKEGRFLDFYQSHREDSLYKPPSDFIQKTIHDVFTVELAGKMQHAINEAFSDGFCMLEYDMVEDNHRYFMARLVKLNDDEVLSIVSDITQLKLYAKELEVLNATKDRLFSIIGHDLKNGLNNIIGFAQLIENKIGEEVISEKYQKYNKLILQSGLSISSLLNNLLTWARAQRKQIVVSPDLFNLHQLIEECYELHRAAFDDKRIAFSNDVAAEVDMCADRSMMHTVFRNLIVNACKFTPREGTVSVNAECLLQHISVRVVDNGIGMDVSKARTLFEISDTSSVRGTEGEEGTGLGLVICKEFVKLNGGEIGVESSLGEGTTFIVKIPLKQNC